jgi:hypothetical protein
MPHERKYPRRAATDTTSHGLRVAVQAACPPVCVRFFSTTDDRESVTYGPYAFVQIRYGTLCGICTQEPRTEEVIANYLPTSKRWWTKDRQRYSDVILYTPPLAPETPCTAKPSRPSP